MSASWITSARTRSQPVLGRVLSPWSSLVGFQRGGLATVAERTDQKQDEVVVDLFEDRMIDLRDSLQQIRQDIQALSAMTAELTTLI
jgi:hypothetical protein